MRSFLVYLNIFCAISITPLHAFENPEIFVQLGHTSSINAIEISPDNKFILSGDYYGKKTDGICRRKTAGDNKEIQTGGAISCGRFKRNGFSVGVD